MVTFRQWLLGFKQLLPKEWDLAGRVVLPGLVDAHTHLDKSYVPTHNQSGTLLEAIDLWRAYKGKRTKADIQATVRRALQTAIANGVTAMRSHVDVESTGDLATVEVILEIKEEVRDQITLQLVALGYANGTTEQRDTIDNALRMGMDFVGGAPALCVDPQAEIDAAFVLAEKYGKPLTCTLTKPKIRNRIASPISRRKQPHMGYRGRLRRDIVVRWPLLTQAQLIGLWIKWLKHNSLSSRSHPAISYSWGARCTQHRAA